MKRYGNLIPLIVDPGNMHEAFNEVVGGLKKRARDRWRERREATILDLSNRIRDGTFRVTTYEEFEVTDGPKKRRVQSPNVHDRIGCNAIMRVVESYIYPTVVRTSAASIKGRGMHKLHAKMERDIHSDREGTRFYYKSDIKKFYENIDQARMKAVVRRYVKGEALLSMLDSFIELMPYGLSIGLRSSQCFGNILLSEADHLMKERMGVEHYYRYCDDTVMLAGSKAELWHLREAWHEAIERLGLSIKHDEAIRPLSEGLDFLGYVTYPTHSLLRKRTKKKAARRLKKVKSRRRRRELKDSLRAVAKWANCRNMYKRLTGEEMKSFKDLGLQYVADDGKKHFDGRQVPLGDLANTTITIVDFEKDVHTENGERTVVRLQMADGTLAKYFTADKQQLWYLERIAELGELPFQTTIKREVYGNGKTRYLFT